MYYLFLLGKAIALILPRTISYRLAELIALGQCFFSRKDREAVLYNLKPLVESQSERSRMAKKAFINFSYYLVDFFRYSKINSKFIEKYVKLENLEVIDRMLAANRGVVLATAHLGNYELGGAVMSLLGYPLYVVALPHRDSRTNRFFNKQRQRVGVKVIPTGLGVKESIAVLKQGKLLALLGDRDFSASGRKQKLFSRYAYIPRGMAFLAKKSGAAIIPAFFIREKKYYYRLIFENETRVDLDGKKDSEFERELLEKYSLVLERYLKKYPEQWYMFQKYWC